MNRRAKSRIAPLAAALLALAGCGGASDAPAEEPPLAGARVGGPFTLVDKAGAPVRWDDFKGKYRTVYFGYTFCPDACPMDVAALIVVRSFLDFVSKRGFAPFAWYRIVLGIFAVGWLTLR